MLTVVQQRLRADLQLRTGTTPRNPTSEWMVA